MAFPAQKHQLLLRQQLLQDKYCDILKNHPGEMTNEEILQELTNWKTMFFPKQMYQRALEMQAAGQSSNTQLLDQVPDMVGGC